MGCDSLNVSTLNAVELNISVGSAAQNTSFTLTLDNGPCRLNADIDANGGLVYNAVSTGVGATTLQCEQGAGL
jgi:hypothetical protein